MNKQTTRLLAALQLGPMTTGEILNELGIARAAARVKELRDMGHEIDTEMVKVRNRFGEEPKVAKYTLVKEAKAAA